MFVAVVSDDTPGYRETFYTGPYEDEKQAQDLCAKFNAKQKTGNWSAWVKEMENMPQQQDWEKQVGENMLNNA